MVDDSSWPPEQPANYTPLLLIHHHGLRTQEQVSDMAELMYTGDISRAMGENVSSKATKEITTILAPLEKKESAFILIEGAPGIGKSVLLKEISYRWANKELLQKFELVLLFSLRDPSLQQITSLDDLLQLFCIGDKNATQIVSTCAEYLFDNGGKSLTLLLDGYDEYPDNLKENSLIAKIIKRQVLPLCGLIVSSRPHASQNLHKQATIRVDILGFTETEREYYIKQAFPDQPHKISELTQYLHQKPFVDSICFIPFNMVILLYLFKLGIPLPRNSTELYNHFICSTICRHLFKSGNPLTHNITDLANLPEPCNKIIRQLSKFSLEALHKNKLIFTLDEITVACPDIVVIPGAINGFGLLQAVQHFGLYTKTVTLNFLHFTIQEFLAAHYISHLPPNEELMVIEENFWNNVYFNMFSIYVSLTKGQRSSFKQFLSDGNEATVIANKFLNDQLKCLHLYRCSNEAGDRVLCSSIEQAQVFEHRKIRPRSTTLTATDMECLSVFLTSSFCRGWVWLNLSFCYIQDKGLNILYRALRYSTDITINRLELTNNGLTTQSSSLISEITVKCKVKKLWINGNVTIGEDQQLYSMLTNSCNELELLNMVATKLSSTAASNLFTALKYNNKLKKLSIDNNDITDDSCDAIIAALERNTCLVTLSMWRNPLSDEAMLNIVQRLQANSTLQTLGLPKCTQSVQEKIRFLQEIINERRESQGCRLKLEIQFM